jgi:hypothetical protein
VSLNEVYRTCQRALEGLGAPVGVDREGAAGIVWLEARGLPGLRELARNLAALDGGFGPVVAGIEIDAVGRSAIAYAGAIIDYLRSLCEPGATATLKLRNVRSPLLLLPAAAARAALGERYLLRFGESDMVAGSALLDEDGATLVLTDGASLDALSCQALTVVLATGPELRMTADMTSQILTPSLLRERASRALADGIAVDDEIWRAVGAVAARVLVPATAESRVRGAGGGDANE